MIELDRIHKVDALEGLRQLEANSVSLVLTDPPYNVASASRQTIRHGKVMSTMKAWGQWDSYDPYDYNLWICQVISQCFRVLKPGGSLYMFTARDDNGFFLRRAVERGFSYRNQLVIVKKNPLPSLAKSNWRSGFEIAFYVTKGKPAVFNFPALQSEGINVYHHPVRDRLTDHPTEKPLKLMERIILASSNLGDLVVDPFAGSGTTLIAAKSLGRRFVGFDTHAEYVRMATDRIHKTSSGHSGSAGVA